MKTNQMNEEIYKIKLRLIKISGKGSLIVLNAKINGVKTNLLLDTGASNSVFDMSNKIFENVRFKSADKYGEASGFNAQIMGLKTGVVKSISMGNYSQEKVKAIFTEMSYLNGLCESYNIPIISGILGCDFLKKHKAIIDFENRILWIK